MKWIDTVNGPSLYVDGNKVLDRIKPTEYGTYYSVITREEFLTLTAAKTNTEDYVAKIDRYIAEVTQKTQISSEVVN